MKLKNLKRLFIALTFTFVGCEDYLEVNPDFGVSEDEVFSDFEATRGYLDNCYEVLLDVLGWRSQFLQRTYIAGLSDEGATLYGSPLNEILNTGSWIDQPNIGEIGWGGQVDAQRGNVVTHALFSMRILNKIIERIDEIPNVSDTDKNQLLGQAYFLRGWYFFEVIRRYGGMPRLDRSFSSNDELDLPRMTYSESTEFVIEDLNRAIDLLPANWDDANFGRANKGEH